MISALHWVPKGACKEKPDKFVPSKEEMRMMEKMSKEHDEQESTRKKEDDLPPEFMMENYDEEDNSAIIQSYIKENMLEEDGEEDMEEDMEEDITDLEIHPDDDLEQEEEEYDKEDIEIRDSDSILLVANTEEEFSSLEVYLYEEDTANLFVHHEITLPAFPLSLAWMNCPLNQNDQTNNGMGNYVAVGTFKPAIEIWNLDILDVMEPTAVLGGEEDSGFRRVAVPNDSNSFGLKPESHQDAVITLDWNQSHRNMLASGSADTTVKIWDVTKEICLYTLTHHIDKVQKVKWNPDESTILATTSFDKSLVILDARTPDAITKFSVSCDIESMEWNPHQPAVLVVSTENGTVLGYDVRMNGSKPLYEFQAHEKAVSAISFSKRVPGLFATASTDKSIKLWDMKENKSTCITSKQMCVGELMSLSFYDDSPFLLATGGSKGIVALWDTLEDSRVEKAFGSRNVADITTNEEIASTLKNANELQEELINEMDSCSIQKPNNSNTDGKKKKKKNNSKKKKNN